METLGDRLRRLRRARYWTLADVANLTDLSISFLSDIERGRTNPSLETLEKLSFVYDVSLADLFGFPDVEEDCPYRLDPVWEEFLYLHPEIDADTADLLRRVEGKAEERARTLRDWTRLYYSLLTLLGRS